MAVLIPDVEWVVPDSSSFQWKHNWLCTIYFHFQVVVSALYGDIQVVVLELYGVLFVPLHLLWLKPGLTRSVWIKTKRMSPTWTGFTASMVELDNDPSDYNCFSESPARKEIGEKKRQETISLVVDWRTSLGSNVRNKYRYQVDR